jgi:hypothetical protein
MKDVICAKCGFPFEGEPKLSDTLQGISGGAPIGICPKCDVKTVVREIDKETAETPPATPPAEPPATPPVEPSAVPPTEPPA